MQPVAQALANMTAALENPRFERLGRVFDDAGFEIALVGGPVRDAMLGRTAVDFDFTTNARPEESLALLRPLATAHWDIGRAFGTVGAMIDGEQVEVTTYRADTYDGTTRKPEVEYGASLEDDLERRDFTINSMAVRLPSRVLVDPFSGTHDLLAGVLRTPRDPMLSFADDPLRMMRAVRFVGQLGFHIEPFTAAAIAELVDSIRIVSAERVHDELVKLVMSDAPERGIEALVDSGLAERVFPELPALQLEVDEHRRHKDVYRHSLTVLRQAIDQEVEPDLVLRLAALMHDIGKPATRKFDTDGTVSFLHHDVVGAKLAKTRLRALRFDNDTVKKVCRLIELHMRFYGYGDAGWTDSAVRRYVRDAGDLLPLLNKLTRADVTTRNQRKANRLASSYDELEHRIDVLAEQEALAAVRPELDGEAIMRILGIGPGPLVGEAYRHMLEVRLDEGVIGVEAAEARLREWFAGREA